MTDIYVGIDVSKDWLDLFDTRTRQGLRAANQDTAFSALIERLSDLAPAKIVLEATGGYEKPIFQALQKAGLSVVRVNPRQVRYFARALGRLAKTDKLDAQLLAEYARLLQPQERIVRQEEQAALSDWVTRRSQIVGLLGQEKNRLKQCRNQALKTMILNSIQALEAQLSCVEGEINRLIAGHASFKALQNVLQEVVGVGPVISQTLLAECPELGRVNSKQIASLAGVAPFSRESGQSKGKPCIWGGRASIRKVLYMGTVRAVHLPGPLQTFFQRLTEAGKPFKVAIVACMRKLIVHLNAVTRDYLQATLQPA